MELAQVVGDVADALVVIDSSHVPFKKFQPGVGPYGEPQLLRAVVKHLNGVSPYGGKACCRRTPDLLVPESWALEFKLARPFGDNGKQAENWKDGLCHPVHQQLVVAAWEVLPTTR